LISYHKGFWQFKTQDLLHPFFTAAQTNIVKSVQSVSKETKNAYYCSKMPDVQGRDE